MVAGGGGGQGCKVTAMKWDRKILEISRKLRRLKKKKHKSNKPLAGLIKRGTLK